MKAKKSFGQHFLNSPKVIRAILDAAEIKKGDKVLEVGPGTGVLTEALLEAGAKLTAVEADRDLIPVLEERFDDKLRLIEGDVLKFRNKDLIKGKYKLVANLPYNVASAILQKFLSESPAPTKLVVMLQKEVGERILGVKGLAGILTHAVGLYADTRRVITVPPGAFSPPPKVSSVVLVMDQNIKHKHPEKVLKLIKAGFRSRRKQLHRNLEDSGMISSEKTKEILEKMDLSPKARAEELSTENWIRLYESV